MPELLLSLFASFILCSARNFSLLLSANQLSAAIPRINVYALLFVALSLRPAFFVHFIWKNCIDKFTSWSSLTVCNRFCSHFHCTVFHWTLRSFGENSQLNRKNVVEFCFLYSFAIPCFVRASNRLKPEPTDTNNISSKPISMHNMRWNRIR